MKHSRIETRHIKGKKFMKFKDDIHYIEEIKIFRKPELSKRRESEK